MQAHVKQYNSTVFELIHDFFKYYSKFDFNTDVSAFLSYVAIIKNCFNSVGGVSFTRKSSEEIPV